MVLFFSFQKFSFLQAKPSPWTGKTFPREQLKVTSAEEQQQVKVVNAAGPDTFFVRPPHLSELIEELENEIKAFTEGVLSILVLPDWQMTAQIGMPCLVTKEAAEDADEEEKKWCRAETLEVSGNGKAKVVLVDTGAQQIVVMKDLRPINAKLVDMPVLVIECKLRGVVPKDGASIWDAAACDVFREIALDRTMGIELVEGEEEEGVNLYTEEKESVASKLIELDLGVDPAAVEQVEEVPTPGVGDELVLYFLSAIGSSEFVCQPAFSADRLAELMDNMAAHYEVSLNQTGVVPEVGLQCVARFTEDDGWYRAVVEAVDGDNVTVRYIDYGNSEVLTKNRLCKIQAEFSELAAQAVTYKVSPALMDPSQWNNDVQALLDVSCAEKELHVTLVDDAPTVKLGDEDVTFIKTSLADSLAAVKQETQGESVSLIFLSVDGPSCMTCQPVSSANDLAELMDNIAAFYEDESNVAESFVPEVGRECIAQFTEDDGWYRAKVTAVDGSNITVLYTDYGNSETLSQDRIRTIQPQFKELAAQAVTYQVTPHLMHTSQWNEDIKALLDESCAERELHVTLVDNAPTIRLGQEDLTFIQTSLGDSLPPVGVETEEKAELGEAVSLLFLSADGPATMTCQPLATANELAELMDNIAVFFEDEINTAESFTPEVNKDCIAQFTEDDGYYRARVTAVDETDVTVLYTDYGNSETLSQERLHIMPPQFQELAAQAVKYHIKPALMHTSQWTDDVKATLDEACADRELKAHLVLGSSDSNIIQLSQEDFDFMKASVADILPPIALDEEDKAGINDVVDALVKMAISDALEEMTIPDGITDAAGITVLTLFSKVTECLLHDELQRGDAGAITGDAESKEEVENVKKLVEDVINKAVEQVCREDGGGEMAGEEAMSHDILDEIIESVAKDLHITAASETLEEGGEDSKEEVGDDGAKDGEEEKVADPDADQDEAAGSQDESDEQRASTRALENDVHPSPQRKRQKSCGEDGKDDDEAPEFELEVKEESFDFVHADEMKMEVVNPPESKKPKMKEASETTCIVGCGTDEDDEEEEDEKEEKEEEETKAEEDANVEEDDDDDEGVEEDFKDAEDDAEEAVADEVTGSGDDKPEGLVDGRLVMLA